MAADTASLPEEPSIAADARHYTIAGRLTALRSFGKAVFADLRFRSDGPGGGRLQILFRKEKLAPQTVAWFDHVDLGDFIAVRGPLMRTRKGEKTLLCSEVTFLGKALRAPPEKWHGLVDVETRYRQRYVDLFANPEVARVFAARSLIVREIRRFLDDRGFLEVETPILHPLVGGATARPFVTHHNALDMDLFLRIAPELYLKRLIVGGLERVYDLGRCFRNEGVSTRHNPEFTMLEAYMAYATYETLMDLVETLIVEVDERLRKALPEFGTARPFSLSRPFRRLTMAEAVRAVDPAAADAGGERLFEAFETKVEPALGPEPVFVVGYPVEVSPLARKSDADGRWVDRFELFLGGREVCNAFNELNDPTEQAERFQAQVKAKARGNDEAMDYDADYVRALEYGMPPTAGLGLGIDRLAMALCNQASIRDVILFPLLRPEVDAK